MTTIFIKNMGEDEGFSVLRWNKHYRKSERLSACNKPHLSNTYIKITEWFLIIHKNCKNHYF